jgi:glycosyltransferase involved in cell wall biosynthesis
MKLSICTVTARKGFVDVLAHMLANQTYKDIEWVLVDFDYEARSLAVKQLSEHLNIKITHSPNVRDDKLFFRDITRNRNKALQLSTGDSVIFLDDYAMIPPEFCEEHLPILNERCISAGNMWRLEKDPGENQISCNEEDATFYYKNPKIILDKFNSSIGRDYRNRDKVYQATGITYTGNLGIPREIFEVLNGFDPRLESGLEDCDFGMRATIAGFKTMFNPTAYTINLDTGKFPYVIQYDHSHDVEPFICNPNNNFAGDDKLKENGFMKVSFMEGYRVATCKICGAKGVIDPNELMNLKASKKDFCTPIGLPGGLK